MKRIITGITISIIIMACLLIEIGLIVGISRSTHEANAGTVADRTFVYLTNSMMVEMPDGNIKIVYRIEINDYEIHRNTLYAEPVLKNVFGKIMIIPLYNIRAVAEGNNKFKEHLLEE